MPMRDLIQRHYVPDETKLHDLRLRLAEASEITELFPLPGWQNVIRRAKDIEAASLNALAAEGRHDEQADAQERGRLMAVRWLLDLTTEIHRERTRLMQQIAETEAPTEGS